MYEEAQTGQAARQGVTDPCRQKVARATIIALLIGALLGALLQNTFYGFFEQVCSDQHIDEGLQP